MNHCERCGHPLTSHDTNGVCLCAVQYGNGRCTCDNYLRAVVSLPEMLAAVLYTGPGRDATGAFYSPHQARLVGRFAEALLDATPQQLATRGEELLEGWCDARPANEVRCYSITRSYEGEVSVSLVARATLAYSWSHSSRGANALRDAAAKVIMKAGQDGFGT